MSLRLKSMDELPAIHRQGGYQPLAQHVPPLQAEQPKRKYKNQVVWEDGERFDSKLELRYYRELKLRMCGGEVRWFIRQVPFRLEGGVIFRADFLVRLMNDGVDVVDCKGFHTRASMNKHKQLKERYGIEVVLWTGRTA
jgi:hypothetical protein